MKQNGFVILRKTWLILCFLLAFLSAGCGSNYSSEDIGLGAHSAVIIEAKSSRKLYVKNIHDKFPPASTVKVMTAIVALDEMSLDDVIIPTDNVLKVEPTITGLKPGVSYTLRDLLYAILIKSANDAAFAIAEHISGSEKAFAVRMNKKAKKIGMRNTYFATASGLPTGEKDLQYTTADDLTKMMRYALRHKFILEAMSKKQHTILGGDGRKHYLKTHNKTLLWDTNAPWGKTGYTKEAKRTFVGVDPSLEPKIVFALLKSNTLWKDIRLLKNKGLEMYLNRRNNIFRRIKKWIVNQRQIGRATSDERRATN